MKAFVDLKEIKNPLKTSQKVIKKETESQVLSHLWKNVVFLNQLHIVLTFLLTLLKNHILSLKMEHIRLINRTRLSFNLKNNYFENKIIGHCEKFRLLIKKSI